MSDQIGPLLKNAKNKDFQALARLLTFIDRQGPQVLEHPELLTPPTSSFRVGVTGPPGAGKSTLIGGLISEFRKKDLSVGVLAIDPSSPFSKGAILGDRIRYSEHFEDSKVFIRSIGTRGSLGGLSASAYLMLRAYDLAQFDITLIETVGVGQTELEIINVADFISVVLVPESGDSIQAMKAGLLEVAHLYVVNKSDRPGADSFVNSLHAYAGSYDKDTEILKTTATENHGLERFSQLILEQRDSLDIYKNRNQKIKLQSEAKSLLKYQLELQLQNELESIENPNDFYRFLKNKVSLK